MRGRSVCPSGSRRGEVDPLDDQPLGDVVVGIDDDGGAVDRLRLSCAGAGAGRRRGPDGCRTSSYTRRWRRPPRSDRTLRERIEAA
jgi:hypothetical protein